MSTAASEIEMTRYRYIIQSGQGLRFDVMTPSNRRICIAHDEKDAKLIVQALNAEARKQSVVSAGMGKSPLRTAVPAKHK